MLDAITVEKARKVIRLIESPIVGERNAAADALHRMARDHSVTVLDLIGSPSPALPAPRPQYRSKIFQLWNIRASLSSWELAFVRSALERVERYGDRTMMSPKQVSTLAAIYERHFGQRERRA
jgi:hypothetical protein